MPIGRSNGLLYAIGQGYSALDAEAARNRLDGFAVVDGLGVTVSTGLTVSIASGTAIVGETSGTVDTVSLGSSTTATLDTADSTNPRKDTIYIDTSGAVQVETGVAEAADPSGNTRFNTFQPEPPLPSTEGVILAEVWVGAGTSSLTSGDIRDRRQPADIVADDLTARTVAAGDLDIAGSDFVASGDFIPIGPSSSTDDDSRFSTTSTSYVDTHLAGMVRWDRYPASLGSWLLEGQLFSSTGDIRLQNRDNSETILEDLDVSSVTNYSIGPGSYTPTTQSAAVRVAQQVRTNDGATSTDIAFARFTSGVQV